MDRLKEWLSSRIAENELSEIGKITLRNLRNDYIIRVYSDRNFMQIGNEEGHCAKDNNVTTNVPHTEGEDNLSQESGSQASPDMDFGDEQINCTEREANKQEINNAADTNSKEGDISTAGSVGNVRETSTESNNQAMDFNESKSVEGAVGTATIPADFFDEISCHGPAIQNDVGKVVASPRDVRETLAKTANQITGFQEDNLDKVEVGKTAAHKDFLDETICKGAVIPNDMEKVVVIGDVKLEELQDIESIIEDSQFYFQDEDFVETSEISINSHHVDELSSRNNIMESSEVATTNYVAPYDNDTGITQQSNVSQVSKDMSEAGGEEISQDSSSQMTRNYYISCVDNEGNKGIRKNSGSITAPFSFEPEYHDMVNSEGSIKGVNDVCSSSNVPSHNTFQRNAKPALSLPQIFDDTSLIMNDKMLLNGNFPQNTGIDNENLNIDIKYFENHLFTETPRTSMGESHAGISEVIKHNKKKLCTTNTKRKTMKPKQKLGLRQLDIKEMLAKTRKTQTFGKSKSDGLDDVSKQINSNSNTNNKKSIENGSPLVTSSSSVMKHQRAELGKVCQKTFSQSKISDFHKCSSKWSKTRKGFLPPFKKQLSFLEERSINKNDSNTDRIEIIKLDDDLIYELDRRLSRMCIIEIVMTLIYRDGFCDLNKPVNCSALSTSKSAGMLMSIVTSERQTPDFFYISFEREHWKNYMAPKNFLNNVLNHSCRKISFCAQELMVELIKNFNFRRGEVCLKWLLLDPLIGCWLLNPEKTLFFFSEVTTELNLAGCTVKKETTSKWIEENCLTSQYVCHLLQQLSLATMVMYQKLQEAGLWNLFLEVETKIISILAVMETWGVCVNGTRLKEMGEVLNLEIQCLKENAYSKAGKHFQLNSPRQLQQILYEELKLDKKSSAKVKSTAALHQKSTSESMLRLLEPFHPLPGILLDYRHLQKLKSTYIDGILQHITDGKICSSWGQNLAATGRVVASNPNLQSVPKQPVNLKGISSNENANQLILDLRSPFHARDGYILLSADFQHIELRILAHMSKDRFLQETFQNTEDIFMSLSNLWQRKETIGSEDREKTKKIVYSVMYGAGPAKLAEVLNIDYKEARTIIQDFLDHFPAIKKFSRSVLEECKATGFLRSISGRRRFFPNINSYKTELKSYSERQAINFVIQGSAADICKCAMIHTEKEFSCHPEFEIHLLMQIHDELVWEVKEEHFHQVKDIIKNILEKCSNECEHKMKISVPLPVVMTSGKDWANMAVI